MNKFTTLSRNLDRDIAI